MDRWYPCDAVSKDSTETKVTASSRMPFVNVIAETGTKFAIAKRALVVEHCFGNVHLSFRGHHPRLLANDAKTFDSASDRYVNQR
ncbi:hypothetical protein [Aureliella helgolandensis]|uniref:Transposase DDE domain-containing protein n=1 Tax=Aureliella helgolandensis TaxID=2527968 RepID=A0A518GB51_9BACT|nr:hypothetical protein [Aureliella helgolandensis]QDV25841.1 hypothetical protein Q31a_41690 [Aureliella helgolandensis]